MLLIFMVTVGITSLVFALINWLIRRRNRKLEIEPFAPAYSLPSIELPKPIKPTRTETIDGVDYVFREHWWFRRFSVNDEIALELCVGYGLEWIEKIKPRRPYVGGGYSHDVRMKARREVLTLEHAKAELDSMYASCCQNVDDSHQELRRMMADCCCTTDTDRTRLIMESCCQSTESRINELRQQLCQQRDQMQANELFWRTQVMTAPPIYPQIHPTVPYASYGYWGGCGYSGGGGYGSF